MKQEKPGNKGSKGIHDVEHKETKNQEKRHKEQVMNKENNGKIGTSAKEVVEEIIEIETVHWVFKQQ